MPLKLSKTGVFLFLALTLFGCSFKNDPASKVSANPVLAVEHQGYRFSMYPEYVSESKSLIKLDVRDRQGLFVKGATAAANLKANDGHVQKVQFREDATLQKYVADVPLKHHEDYTVDTEVSFEKEKFRPEFIFHCGDPVPELVEIEAGSESK